MTRSVQIRQPAISSFSVFTVCSINSMLVDWMSHVTRLQPHMMRHLGGRLGGSVGFQDNRSPVASMNQFCMFHNVCEDDQRWTRSQHIRLYDLFTCLKTHQLWHSVDSFIGIRGMFLEKLFNSKINHVNPFKNPDVEWINSRAKRRLLDTTSSGHQGLQC